MDALPSGGALRFPPGTYRIESDQGIVLKDDVRLDLGDAVLVGANVDGARCRLLESRASRNVVISGGTLVGSRSGAPDWGVGIFASDAEDLLIENVTLQDFYFDGILLTGNQGCERVVVRGVVARNNRRTGLAVPAARHVTVEDSTLHRHPRAVPGGGRELRAQPGGRGPRRAHTQVHVLRQRGRRALRPPCQGEAPWRTRRSRTLWCRTTGRAS